MDITVIEHDTVKYSDVLWYLLFPESDRLAVECAGEKKKQVQITKL